MWDSTQLLGNRNSRTKFDGVNICVDWESRDKEGSKPKSRVLKTNTGFDLQQEEMKQNTSVLPERQPGFTLVLQEGIGNQHLRAVSLYRVK